MEECENSKRGELEILETKKASIHVVEDDAEMRDTLSNILLEKCYEVKTTAGDALTLDITERKWEGEEVEKAEKVSGFFTIVDSDGKIIFFDRTLPCFTKEKVIGTSVYDYISPDYRDKLKEKIKEVFKTKKSVILETSDVGPKGVRRWYENYIGPVIQKGQVDKLIFFIRGITERKKAENELEAKNIELEKFTYTVSHDLRSPLITAQGFVKLLRDDLEHGEKEKVETDLKFIESCVTKMDHLLTDTLQLSRIGRVTNPPEDVSFVEIVQEALEQITCQIKSSGVEVSVAEDFPIVHVDQMRIMEVLVNLIGNSINYMDLQQHPKIEIGYRVEGEETVFFVKDNGIGIDKSQHEKVFELFYKLDKSSNGTGAGLAIVKRIIEVHGGRIWIESEEGKGCTVCFTVPVS